MKDHLEALKDDYTKATATERTTIVAEKSPDLEVSTVSLLEQLIDRFDIDSRAVVEVRTMCMRTHYVMALKEWPPYYDAVITLRTRLNFWLNAWRAHMEHKDGRLGEANPDEIKSAVHRHLKAWLEAEDKLPKYPASLPLHINPNAALIVPGGSGNEQKPEAEPKPKPKPKPETAEEDTKGPSIFDFRTHSRKESDGRARRAGSRG